MILASQVVRSAKGQGESMSGEASNQDRVSGVLLHVTSLPSYGGVGDFGTADAHWSPGVDDAP